MSFSPSDLDECESGEACCARLCINYLGSYKCRCQEGVISSDGGGCDGKFLRSNMNSLCDGATMQEEHLRPRVRGGKGSF